MVVKQIFVFLSIFLLVFVGHAQNTVYQNQLWVNYNFQLPFAKQKSFQLEISERIFTNPFEHALLAFRGTYRFPVGKNKEMALGIANFNQTPTDPLAQPRLSIPEIRPTIDFIYKRPFKKFSLENRVRVEPRFYNIPNSSKTELTDVVTLGAVRWRDRLQAMIPINSKWDSRIGTELLLHSEVNLATRGFDQLRFIGALTYKFSSKTQLEAAYIHQLQSKGIIDYFERDILWLNFTQKIKWN